MPRVDSIEALADAVQAFDATPLGLQVGSGGRRRRPGVSAADRLSAAGRAAGLEQTPVLVEEVISWFGLDGIALEWDANLGAWLDRWLADGVLVDPARGDPAMQVCLLHGRLTAWHLAVLRRLTAAGLLITLMDRQAGRALTTWGE